VAEGFSAQQLLHLAQIRLEALEQQQANLAGCLEPRRVNQPLLEQQTPRQGSADLEHNNLVRILDFSELTIKTSHLLASEDSGNLHLVPLQPLEQHQGAFQRPQVSLEACLEQIIRTSQQQDLEDSANPPRVPQQLLDPLQLVLVSTLVLDFLEQITKISQQHSALTQEL